MLNNSTEVAEIFKKGQVGVIPTDTIYGICGSAMDEKVVERIYELRKRNKDKPMIILISDISDLEKFNINLSENIKKVLEKLWPNPVSVILTCSDEKFSYLHRGQKSLAFRIPKLDFLLDILKQSGPLVAPSANLEGENPSENIEDAKKCFGNKVDFYIEGGTIKSQPSTLIKISEDREIAVLRQGVYKI